MSKRSNFPKVEKDYYPTVDPKAIPSQLVKFIRGKTYAEPCCGAGDLVDLLYDISICKWESDIVYRGAGHQRDALTLGISDLDKCDLIITNPPYTRGVLLPLIDKFLSLKPTWLLLPADMMHNKYFAEYMRKCTRVVSVGRLKWFSDSKYTSTDNYCWYFWPKNPTGDAPTVFYGRGT